MRFPIAPALMTPAATATARDGTSVRKKAPTKTAIERATQP